MVTGSAVSRLALLLGLTLLLGAGVATAQGRPSLTVTVLGSDDHRPLAGAQVSVLGSSIHGVTGVDGVAHLEGVRPGQRTVEVQHVGYMATRTLTIIPTSGADLQVELIPDP